MKKKNKGWASLSYFGLLVIFPLISKQNDEFVMYHAKQGIILSFLGIVLTMFSRVAHSSLFTLLWLISLAYTLIGVTNCVRGVQKPLPLIGKYAEELQF